MASDNLARIVRSAQACILESPVLVLGSGASAPYGLRGMVPLAKHLLESVEPNGEDELDAWVLVRTALASGDGLEEALLKSSAPPSLVAKIVARTWEAIALDDLALMHKLSRREIELGLSKILQGLFRSTHKIISIVTTNYDRVAEYSSDMAGYMHETGFSPGLIRSRQNDSVVPYVNGQESRRVRIWKVHGSLDWLVDQAEIPICLPLSSTIPEGFTPLIVTPGTSKYERTHDEPFRSAIQGADVALSRASAILCIGYGFRDRHIQPKIIERCRNSNIPIVVLARTLTLEAHAFLKKSGGQYWLALENHKEGTRAFSPDHPDGIVLPGNEYWSFDGFNRMVF